MNHPKRVYRANSIWSNKQRDKARGYKLYPGSYDSYSDGHCLKSQATHFDIYVRTIYKYNKS